MIGLLWGLVVILVIAWVIGFILVHVASFAIHILIVAAIIIAIWNLISSRRSAA